MDKSLGTLLHISRTFPNSHRPKPSPHPTKTVVSRILFRVSTLYRWGEGEEQENFEKDAPFYEGTQKWQKNMNIALLSQRLLSMKVGLPFSLFELWRTSGLLHKASVVINTIITYDRFAIHSRSFQIIQKRQKLNPFGKNYNPGQNYLRKCFH